MDCCGETPPSGITHVVGLMETKVCCTLRRGPCIPLEDLPTRTTDQPFTCSSSDTCVADAQYTAFGCCDSVGDCYFTTACIDSNPGICESSKPGDCFHYQYTVGWYVVTSQKIPCVSTPRLNLSFGNLRNNINSVGNWGCITYVMLGRVPFSSADCNDNPGTVYIQTTYAGGPSNQQIPMPYTDYLVTASSAAAASSSSSSAAEASSTGDSDSSSDDIAVSNWVSHHKALLIGVIVGVVALLLLGCCLTCFRRKKTVRARSAPVPPVGPPPNYQYSPQQGMQGQEHYPMMQYQYGPNK